MEVEDKNYRQINDSDRLCVRSSNIRVMEMLELWMDPRCLSINTRASLLEAPQPRTVSKLQEGNSNHNSQYRIKKAHHSPDSSDSSERSKRVLNRLVDNILPEMEEVSATCATMVSCSATMKEGSKDWTNVKEEGAIDG